MRFAVLFAGLLGFAIVVLVGLASGRSLEPLLRDASLACLLCAFVGRWFWTGLEQAFAQTLEQKRAAAEAAEHEAAAAPAAPSASAPAARGTASTPKTAAPALAAASAPARR